MALRRPFAAGLMLFSAFTLAMRCARASYYPDDGLMIDLISTPGAVMLLTPLCFCRYAAIASAILICHVIFHFRHFRHAALRLPRYAIRCCRRACCHALMRDDECY